MIRTILVSSILLTLCITLSGCGGDPGSNSSPTGSTEPRPAPAQPTKAPGSDLSETPRSGGAAAPGRPAAGGGNTTGG